jgi:hypothetical protein
MLPRRSRLNLPAAAIVLGLCWLYCFIGALGGHLKVPLRYSADFAALDGNAAWIFLAGFSAFYAAAGIRRFGRVVLPSPGLRQGLFVALLVAGVVLIGLAGLLQAVATT